MKKKKIISLTLVATLGTMLLSGCSSNNIEESTGAVLTKTDRNLFEYYTEEPKTKLFEPGEHVLYKRYFPPSYEGNAIYNTRSYAVDRGSISVPEGYEIISVNSVSLGSNTRYNEYDCVDVWFVNKDKVYVEPILNESTGLYDYSEFGMVMIDLIDYGQTYSK